MIDCYRNIDELPVFNWDKYIKSQNNNWLIIGFDGRQPIIKDNDLVKLENDLQEQYFLELDDKSIYTRLQKMAKIDNLITKYNTVQILLNRLKLGFYESQEDTKKQIYKMLASRGFRIRSETEEELKEMFVLCEAIKTQIDIIQSELRLIKKSDPKSLTYQLKTIEKGLGFTTSLNPKEVTVKDFIGLCKELESWQTKTQ